MDFDQEFKAFLNEDQPSVQDPNDVEDGIQELGRRVARYHAILQENGLDGQTSAVLCVQYQTFLLSYNVMLRDESD